MLDRLDRYPLHRQLEGRLKDLVGALEPGEPIQSERQLCVRYGVSRTTVRLAIANLVHAGLLVRGHGRGTFVAQPRFVQRWTALTSFTAGVSDRGVVPTIRELNREIVHAPTAIASALEIGLGSEVVKIRRLRLINSQPAVITTSYFGRIFDFLVVVPTDREPLWSRIESASGRRAVRATQMLELTTLEPDDAALLDEKPGAPAFFMSSTLFDQESRPFEVVRATYRAPFTRFLIELHTESDKDATRSVSMAVP